MTQTGDQDTTFRKGLIGFYASCTVVGTASAVAAVCWIVFSQDPGLAIVAWVACAIAAVFSVLTWYFLRLSRGGS